MPMYRILMDPDATSGLVPNEEGESLAPSEQAEAERGREELETRLRTVESAYAEQLAEQGRKAAVLERAYKAAVLERELATALAGRPLVAGAAAQLIKLWRDDFDVLEEGGASRVVARDGRGAGQVIAERLASPEFAHFCQPASRGGTAARSPAQSAGIGSEPPPPKNLGEAAIRRWMEDATRLGGNAAPIGLNRRRR